MSTVCAVVLTYNRRDLLNDCLQAIRAQTRPCDRILVIDNASTDGTSEMLAERWADQAEIHVLARNVGAAGGFSLGMRLAYQTGTDYIWVMDDDVIPEPEALAHLLAAGDLLAARNQDPPFLCSVARAPSGLLTNVPDIDRRQNALSYENWPDLLDRRLAPVTRATLVSNLMPRRTLERHGLPIATMFIWGEDSEFTLRVTRTSPGYLVGDSQVVHVRQLAGVLDIRTETNPTRIAYQFHRLRNDIYLKRRYEGRRAVARHLRHQARLALELCLRREFAKAWIVVRGAVAGLTFNPAIEAADTPFHLAATRQVGPAAPASAPRGNMDAGSASALRPVA